MAFNFDAPEDVFDTREVEERIAELELEYGPEEGDGIDTLHLEKMDEDEHEEYRALIQFREDVQDVTREWDSGETLIADDYFEVFTEEWASDLGEIPRDFPAWIVIDWAETADNLKQDYESVTLNGVDYWVRRG